VRWAIIDTDVYIDYWEGISAVEEAVAQLRRAFVIRHSSVVLSELRRGARSASARRLVQALYRLASMQWAPTADDWWRAGDLVRAVGDSHDWEIAKRREFQNDALIALTARRFGATLVTRNRVDFSLLERRCRVTMLYV
jgi:predicted nucleic acid-binding protein